MIKTMRMMMTVTHNMIPRCLPSTGLSTSTLRRCTRRSIKSTQKRHFSWTYVCQTRTSELTEEHISALHAQPTRLWEMIHSTAEWGHANRYGDAPEETGLSRLTLSDTDKQARDWFVETTKSLGCKVTVDEIGNTFAVRPGRRNDIPATFAGSHLDSQPMGGRFDGILGVCAGVEMLKVLDEQQIETEAPIGVVNWTNEEGARFPVSMMGSGVWSGARNLEETFALKEVTSQTGEPKTVLQELERIGYKGAVKANWKEGVPVGAHFELHIEQGPYLEGSGQKIGMVEGVQAYKWFEIVVKGQAAHTGATGYEFRADALHWTSRIILEVREIAQRLGGLASVGVIKSEPQSVNTVPDKVTFSLDVRHKNNEKMLEISDQIARFLPTVEENSRSQNSPGVTTSMRETFVSWATIFDSKAVGCVEKSALALVKGDTSLVRRMVSGAGHDTVNTQMRCPSAMIFIPCRDGVSHNPVEWSSKEDCANGASVLLQAVLRFDMYRQRSGGSNK